LLPTHQRHPTMAIKANTQIGKEAMAWDCWHSFTLRKHWRS
jgi:hypothetical protein